MRTGTWCWSATSREMRARGRISSSSGIRAGRTKERWLRHAEAHGRWERPRPGKRVALFSVEQERKWRGYEYRIRRVMRVVERTVGADGQVLLVPEVEREG